MPSRPSIRPEEDGYTLVAVIFLMALLALTLSIAAPRLAREIQRDREVETMQRGKQYARAIRNYYKKNGAYPPSLEALTKSGTGNIRFLRKRYTDPLTRKDDWKPVLAGQNKAPAVMGFFGQALAGTGSGVGSYAGGAINGANTLGSSATTSTATSATKPTTGTFGSSTSSTSTNSGPTFGGAGMMGFSPPVDKPSLLVYKTKKRYNEWEFVYDPRSEQQAAAGSATGAKSAATAFGPSTSSSSSSSSTPSTTR